jgi:hypothetical protein
MRIHSVFACLGAWFGLAASPVAAEPSLAGAQIELLPVSGCSFFAGSIVASPDDAHVYAGGNFDVRGLSRDVLSGELTEIDEEDVQNAAIAISPDGAHLYVAESAQLAVFARNAESGLLELVGTVTPETGGTEALVGIIALAVSPDGGFVYVITRSSNGILVFTRDALTGALGAFPLVIDMTVAPTKILFSPTGTHAYVLSISEEELRIYARSSATGALTWLDTLSQLVFSVDDEPSHHLDIALSPDGEMLELTSSPEGTITAFARDAATGALTFADERVLYPSNILPRTLLQLATGKSITWVSSFTPAGPQPTSESRLDLTALARDPGSEPIGTVTLTGTLTVSNLALAPDERHVYFGGFPCGVGGAKLVPEPAAGALGATAMAVLMLRARRRVGPPVSLH